MYHYIIYHRDYMLFCTQCSNIAGRQESLIKIADKDTILISKKKYQFTYLLLPKINQYLIYYNIFQYQVIIQSRLKLLCSLPINFYYVC